MTLSNEDVPVSANKSPRKHRRYSAARIIDATQELQYLQALDSFSWPWPVDLSGKPFKPIGW